MEIGSCLPRLSMTLPSGKPFRTTTEKSAGTQLPAALQIWPPSPQPVPTVHGAGAAQFSVKVARLNLGSQPPPAGNAPSVTTSVIGTTPGVDGQVKVAVSVPASSCEAAEIVPEAAAHSNASEGGSGARAVAVS